MDHTRGGACVIGRTSYEAMVKGGHVNDKRRFFLISRDKSLAGPFTEVFSSSIEALDAAKASGLTIWICGGPRIYTDVMPIADRLYLTQIHTKIENCDAWMPDWKNDFSSKSIYLREGKDEVFRYTFMVLERNEVRMP